MADEQPPDRGQPPDASGDEVVFRWSHFFQRSTEPLFVLNRRRQLLFVNTAWEALTGHKARDVHKRVCKRQRDAAAGSCEAVQHALCPPQDVLAGKLTRVRRLFVPAEGGPRWWDILFVPLLGPHGVLGVVAKIQQLGIGHTYFGQPLPEKLMALRQRHAQWYGLANLDTGSPAMQRVAQQVNLASRLRIPVLLVGEEGTGKEWLARTIHRESDERENTFVALDCQHLPVAALVRVLFGPGGWVQRGAVTLYFREPADLPRELQARLHELLTIADSDRPLPRVLAGCNTDPAADVRSGRLLDEWHCWLSPLTIHVPPLRERLADLPSLVQRLLQRAGSASDRPITGLSAEAWELVRGYGWPGNVRELYAVLASSCTRCRGEVLQPADLPWYLRPVPPVGDRKLPLDQLLEQVERRLIQMALAMAKGNKSRAAEILAIWRPRLMRRIEALGIEEAH